MTGHGRARDEIVSSSFFLSPDEKERESGKRSLASEPRLEIYIDLFLYLFYIGLFLFYLKKKILTV